MQPAANGWLAGRREAQLPCLVQDKLSNYDLHSRDLHRIGWEGTLPEIVPLSYFFLFSDLFSSLLFQFLLESHSYIITCVKLSCFRVCFWGTRPPTTPDEDDFLWFGIFQQHCFPVLIGLLRVIVMDLLSCPSWLAPALPQFFSASLALDLSRLHD